MEKVANQVLDTVNFRTNKESYKDRRRVKVPEDEWKIFENTHPAIVDEETWQLAQRCRETKRRPNYMGDANPLTGLIYCADCGEKMYNHREAKSDKLVYHKNIGKYYPRYPKDTYGCSTYSQTSHNLNKKCTQHFIRTAAVRELLLETIKAVSCFAKENEAAFIEQVREASELRQESEAKTYRRQLAKNEKRHSELDMIISKLFEQNAAGKIPDARFETLLAGYEKEQTELSAQVVQLHKKLADFDADSEKVDRFIEIAKRYTDFTELTAPMINEFVEKIVVHEGDKSSGERTQKVDIYLNFIGKFDMPAAEPTAEEIVAMEKLQRQRERKRANGRRFVEKRQRDMAEEQTKNSA